MHTEYDTQTVARTLALYGVKRRVWAHRMAVALASTAGIIVGTVAGHLVKGMLGW